MSFLPVAYDVFLKIVPLLTKHYSAETLRLQKHIKFGYHNNWVRNIENLCQRDIE